MFGRLTSGSKHGHSAPSRSKTTAPSVIAEGMHVLGNIISDGMVDIDGQISGNVRAHTVSLRGNGKVRGDVMADILHVYGEVEGVIRAQTVILYATARVTGTIIHESLTIDDGAFVDGKFKRTAHPLSESANDAASRRLAAPLLDATFDNDNDEPPSEAEIRILESLRLIS